MKVCTDCPTKFVGGGERCDPCRRRFEKHGAKGVIASVPSVPKKPLKNFIPDESPARRSSPDAPLPGEVCPTCGRKRPMTSGQRVRRHRAKSE